LKQASTTWYQKLFEYLNHINLQESGADPLLYVRHDGNQIVVICIYVNDLIITRNDDIGIQVV
jgi:hypothetical protein